jgi:intein/homing endonuclease
MMDTDGYAAKDKCAVYYDTTSERLANDLAFVIRSLGGHVKITTKIGSYKKNNKKIICKKVYKLYIKHRNPEKLFSLKRKVERTIGNSIMFKIIKSIEIKGEITGRCITVSNPNGLYITNDFIVTHNSY